MPQSSEIVWFVATSDEPVTTEEIADYLCSGCKNVRYLAKLMYDEGLLEREKRRNGSIGPDPYEYTIAEREGDRQ